MPVPDPTQLDMVLLAGPTALWTVLVAVAALVLAAIARRLGWSLGGPATTDDGPPDAPSTLGPGSNANGTPASEPGPVTGPLDEDEQFVVDLLLQNDGRVRQSAVVEASDWSKSKVSRLLSRMERDGHVEKVTVGRENVIVLVVERDG